MPLIIPGAGPVAGTLPAAAALTDLISAYPGLIGAFDDDGLPTTDGATVTAWTAKIGSGQLTQTSARAPTSSLIDGKRTASFDGTKSLKVPITGTAPAPLTYGLRFYHRDPTVDVQRAGLWSGANYLGWRSATGLWFVNGAAGCAVNTAKTPGWHTLILTFQGTTARMDLDGVVAEVTWTPPASITTLGIASYNVDSVPSGSLIGNVRRAVMAQGSAYGGDGYEAIKTWLERP